MSWNDWPHVRGTGGQAPWNTQSLVSRAAFSEIFAYGGDLTRMMNDPEMVTGGKVDKALENAQKFTEAVYERIK